VDASLTQKQTIFLQMIAQNSPAVNPGLMPYTGTFTPLEAQLATIQHTYVLTPTLVNSFRLGFVRERVFQSNEGVQLGHILDDIGIHNTLDDRGLSGVSITGYASLGRASGDLGNQDNNYQLDESLTQIHGAHNFQYGLGIRYKRIQDQNANAGALGNTFFQSTFTAQLAPNAQGALALQANTGNPFADFLLGYPTTGQLAGLPLLPYRFTQYTPYFQDTWKVARGLTFNYGISWFLATPPDPQGSARQLTHSFDFGSGLLKYAALGEIDPKVQRTDRKDFTPRFGVAWTPRFPPQDRGSGGRRRLLQRFAAGGRAVCGRSPRRSTHRFRLPTIHSRPCPPIRSGRISFPPRRPCRSIRTMRRVYPTGPPHSCSIRRARIPMSPSGTSRSSIP